MKATEILVKEHGLICQALDSLTQARRKLEKGESPPAEFFEMAVQFAQRFADKFHHFKEEYLMFSLLAQKKKGALDAEIGALRYQHEIGRKCIARLADAIEGYAKCDEIATTVLLENLAIYTSLLRRHIHLEDHVFFKMTEAELSDHEHGALLQQFQNEEKAFEESDLFEKSRIVVQNMRALLDG